MKARSFFRRVGVVAMGLIFTGVAFQAAADLIEMRNGDRYVGTVVSIDAKHLRLKNENLGILRIERQKISTVHLGEAAPAPVSAAAISTRAATNALAAVKPAGAPAATDQSVVDEIKGQFLAAAGPEANALFDSTVQGVLSGKITVGDIRSQAQTAANQIRKLQGELGGEGEALDGYLSILDHFLSETRNVSPTTQAAEIVR